MGRIEWTLRFARTRWQKTEPVTRGVHVSQDWLPAQCTLCNPITAWQGNISSSLQKSTGFQLSFDGIQIYITGIFDTPTLGKIFREDSCSKMVPQWRFFSLFHKAAMVVMWPEVVSELVSSRATGAAVWHWALKLVSSCATGDAGVLPCHWWCWCPPMPLVILYGTELWFKLKSSKLQKTT